MRRTSTGRALINRGGAASAATGGAGGPESAAPTPAAALDDSPSGITVMPVDVLRHPHRDRLAGRAGELPGLRFCEPVHVGVVTAQILAALNADVVLLDVRTVRPAAVYRSVARLRSAAARPMVLLLDPADLEVMAVCTSLGVADFILSTASTAELVARLRRARRCLMPPGATNSASGVPGIELHWRTHEVSAGSTRIALTLRELQLLAALMDRPGEVLTSDDLARLAWGKHAAAGGGLTAAYVCSLRKKLAWFGGRFGIRTVRGVGYLFVV